MITRAGFTGSWSGALRISKFATNETNPAAFYNRASARRVL